MYESFTVHMDHATLHWILKINERSGRLMRCQLRPAEYEFEVKYITGRANAKADAPSRLTTTAGTSYRDMDDIPAFSILGATDTD